MEEVTLFKPGNRNIKIEYPELSDIPEFEGLNTMELKFVWYFANRTSPHYNDTNITRKISKALKDSYGNSIDDDLRAKYLSESFPHKIKTAIKRMEEFNPSHRLKAKLSLERIFENLQKLVNIGEEDLIEMELNNKKDYVALAIKISESMPGIVRQLEEGFGVEYTKTSKAKSNEPSLMDKLHMEEQDF